MGVVHHLSFAAFAHRHRRGGLGGVLAAATMIFALGLATGATIRPVLQNSAALATAVQDRKPASFAVLSSPRFESPVVYPAEIIRVIDGDTFEARLRVWPGIDVNTKVRLRNIDAPELHARCADEHDKAEAARAALQTILAAGDVTISRVGLDKYGGRVGALISTRDTADVSTRAFSIAAGRVATTAAGAVRGADLLVLSEVGHQDLLENVLTPDPDPPVRHRALMPDGLTPTELLHDDARPDTDAPVQILDVLVVHADAAIRDEMADRSGVIGAVNGVFAAGKRHCRNAHRIARRAAGDNFREVGLVFPDFRGRRPIGPNILAVDVRRSRPLLADSADADRIADGLAEAGYVIKTPLAGAHHDGARHERLFHRHRLAARKSRLRDDRERAGSGSKRGRNQDRPSHRRSPRVSSPADS
jgi:endonuclease YncB( thermonuclease family)